MSANYPTSAPSFTTKTDTDTIQAAHMNAVQDEATAIGTALIGTLAHDVKVASTRHFYEDGLSTYLGQKIDVAYAAGNFSASESMTWTVEAADVGEFSYARAGKTVAVSWYFHDTAIGGSASHSLYLTIPGGATAASRGFNPCLIVQNGVAKIGYSESTTGTTTIAIHLPDAANFSITSPVTVAGQLLLQVA